MFLFFQEKITLSYLILLSWSLQAHKNTQKWLKMGLKIDFYFDTKTAFEAVNIHRMLLKLVLAVQTIEQGPKLQVRHVHVLLALNSFWALVKQGQ